jgi:hypothetical protein
LVTYPHSKNPRLWCALMEALEFLRSLSFVPPINYPDGSRMRFKEEMKIFGGFQYFVVMKALKFQVEAQRPQWSIVEG